MPPSIAPYPLANRLDRVSVIPVEVPSLDRGATAWTRYEQVRARLGLIGAEQEDIGNRLVSRNADGRLEFFKHSGALRWTRTPFPRVESGRVGRPPASRLARRVADATSRELGLLERSAYFSSVDHTMLEESPEAPPDRASNGRPRAVAAHATFRFRILGVPVVGPGARMVFTLGDGRRVDRWYKFWRFPWREPGPAEPTIGLRPAEEASERMLDSPAFAQLSRDRARVVVRQHLIGYFAAPPREIQRALVPVYVFRGEVEVHGRREPYPFVRYVLAADDARRFELDPALRPLIIV